MAALVYYPIASLFGNAVLVISFCAIALAVRRLAFHPLSKFPGPRLAAVSSLYKTYFEVVKGGELLERIHYLHSIHGDVVRIGPNELHFNDYRAFAEIYSVESRLTKDSTFYSCFNASDSAFGAIDPIDSKARRGVMHSFFSKRAVSQLEETVRQKVDLLVSKVACRGDTPANMFLAFRCATVDIVTTYMFGRCPDTLNEPDFAAPLVTNIQVALPLLWFAKAFPLAVPLLAIIPQWLGKGPKIQFHAFCSIRDYIIDWLDRSSKEAESDSNIIFRRLLSPSTVVSRRSLSIPYLDEALSLLQAGSDPVANTCTVGTFHVLNNRTVLTKLTTELQSIWPDAEDPIDVAALQNLPYLTAVIKEALRLSHGCVTPLPRVVGPLGARIAGYHIPPNTTVAMSVTAVHLNPDLFPESSSFIPERWLQNSSPALDRYLVSFSKGPRMCLGMSMAWLELYLLFGYIFRKLEMEVIDTSVEDFRSFKDYFVPVYQGRNLHIRATRLQ